LDVAAGASEYTVWIGNSTCRVTSIDSSTLYCSPPANQPLGLSTSGLPDSAVLPLVKVLSQVATNCSSRLRRS